MLYLSWRWREPRTTALVRVSTLALSSEPSTSQPIIGTAGRLPCDNSSDPEVRSIRLAPQIECRRWGAQIASRFSDLRHRPTIEALLGSLALLEIQPRG